MTGPPEASATLTLQTLAMLSLPLHLLRIMWLIILVKYIKLSIKPTCSRP